MVHQEGWLPDPEDPERMRYWDGSAWTERVVPRIGLRDEGGASRTGTKRWWRRWWAILPLVLVAACVALIAFMYFFGFAFLDARADYEIDAAEDAFYEGRYQDAAAQASEAIDMSTQEAVRAKAHLIRASARYELGQFQQAATDATSAIELATRSRSGIVAVSYAVRAQTYVDLERFDEAIDDATISIGLAGDDHYAAAVAHLARGAAYLETGADTGLAVADLEQGVQEAHKLPTLGLVPSFRRRIDRAEALFSELDS